MALAPAGHAMRVPAKARSDALELDVFRGFAAILMIVNHAGVRLLAATDATSSASGTAVFLGSFAPALFFFATGFGAGLGSAAGRELDLAAAAWKAALLVVADQFFFWAGGAAWGLDFFSFIALSSIVVAVVATARRPDGPASC